MEKEKVMRMMSILSEEKSTPEDMAFVRNNLEGLNTFLYNVATQELIADGVAPDKVEGLLQPLVGIARMQGASSFLDYQVVAELMEGN